MGNIRAWDGKAENKGRGGRGGGFTMFVSNDIYSLCSLSISLPTSIRWLTEVLENIPFTWGSLLCSV